MPENVHWVSSWQEVLKKSRIPAGTYRLQFSRDFTFHDAAAILPYLQQLGITDIYASPIFLAVPGSLHGYDICDHSLVNPELGGEAGLNELAEALRARDMGLMLDFVPNHMAAHPSANVWWKDVLENGPSSPYALYFDIDWDPVKPELKDKILLPILGDQYGQVLERGELRLEYEEGLFCLAYFEHRLPVNPRQAVKILKWNMERLRGALGEENPDLREFLSIQTALNNLPSYTERDPERIEERRREKEVCRNRLDRLASENSRILEHIRGNLRIFNGEPGNRASFDLLHEVLEVQAYRLAYWKTALYEINYRRFFDINGLAGLRQEYEPAFARSHAALLRFIREGKITGLRLDHIDGLYDPAAYLAKLQAHIAAARSGGSETAGTPETPAAVKPEFYVVVEKILSLGETLPAHWATHGTSGYDFLNDLNGIFIEARNALDMKKIYSRFIRESPVLPDIMYQSKFAIMVDSMTSELSVLTHALNRLSELDRRTRDFTLESLRRAIREVVAVFPIYRTYVTSDGWKENDEKVIDAALAKTRSQHPTMEPTILDFLRANLLPAGKDKADEHFPQRLEFAMKLQQYTAPVQAKGLEDTAFYRYNLLLSLNEVGGEPQRFGRSLNEFHQANLRRRESHPLAMLTTSTHDTKRGEDARMRLNVLSELAGEWRRHLREWSALNKSLKSQIAGAWVPDRNEEYFIYQTLLGVWPAGWEGEEAPAELTPRLRQYLLKAVREAKIHTSWIHNNAPYEEAVLRFADQLLAGPRSKRFLRTFLPFQRRIAFFGMLNSLAQTALKIAAPGVPDTYQGTEYWDLSLADPDNRRPVDFTARRAALETLELQAKASPEEIRSGLRELFDCWPDARIKLWVTARALRLRRERKELFLLGDYHPVTAEGEWNAFTAGFCRSHWNQHCIVLVPRRVCSLTGGRENVPPLGEEVWRDGRVVLPAACAGRSFRNIFTGAVLRETPGLPGSLALAEIFSDWPVALLISEE